MGCIYKLKNSPFYWIKYVGVDGRPQYESSRSTDHATAKSMLQLREGKIADGVPVTAAVGRFKFTDAADDLVNHYKIKGRRTLAELELRLRLHLRPFFGRYRMAQIDTALAQRYIVHRQAEQRIVRKARTIIHRDRKRNEIRREEIPAVLRSPSNATINRELEHLVACFTLAKKGGRLLHVPHIPMLDENNVRKGFLEPAQLNDVLAQLPEHYRPVVRLTYLTGWRMASEVLNLEWRQVDFDAGEIRLDPGTTKNQEGRVFPFSDGDDLHRLLSERRKATDALQKKLGRMIPMVFYRVVKGARGKRIEPIKSFYKAWRTACGRAGVPGRIPHDMRRSSARNMVTRRGVPQKVAQELMGHKTAAIFSRYNIVSAADLREGAQRLTGLLDTPEVKAEVKLRAINGSRGRHSR